MRRSNDGRERSYWKQAVYFAAVVSLLSAVLVVLREDATTAATACTSAAEDSDGDGWGWENGESCKVETASNPGKQSASPQPDSNQQNSASGTPCTAAAEDSDGDGWGWENGASCKVTAPVEPVVQTQSDAPQTQNDAPQTQADQTTTDSPYSILRPDREVPTPVTTEPAVGDFPFCLNNTSGGFGWENEMSCLAEARTTKPTRFCDVEVWDSAGFSFGRIGGEVCQIISTQRPITETPTVDEPIVDVPSIFDVIQNLPVLPSAYSEQCATIESFMAGCNVSVQKTQSYSNFLQSNGVADGSLDVGARVQLQGSQFSIPPTEKVLYVVGPYLGAEDEENDLDSIAAEINMVQNEAPALRQIMDRHADVAVVYIGFGDAPDSHLPVASRVDATKQVIRSFEAVRAAQGSRGQSMLVGVSLGGVAGKIALHELESEGFDHGVDTYVSFDSPHHGAYTPHSLQYIPIFMQDSLAWIDNKHFGLLPNRAEREAGKAINLTLRSPVAQDLLISNLGYSDHKSPNIGYVQSRYADLPRSTRNVAIASGSIDGSRPTTGPDILTVETGKASSSRAKAMVNFRTLLPNTDQDTVTFSGQLSFKALLSGIKIGKRIKYSRTFTVSPAWARAYDRGPCSRSDMMVAELRNTMDFALAEVWSDRTVTNEGGAACFIPTYSATIGNFVNGEQVVGATAFDQVIGDSENKNHLATSNAMDSQILAVVDDTFGSGAVMSFRSRQVRATGGGNVQPLKDSIFETTVESFDYVDEDGNVVSDAELRAAKIIE